MPIDVLKEIQTNPLMLQAVAQEQARQDGLFKFCRDVLGYTDMNAEHEALCEYLQYDQSPIRLMLMPRYTFKSSIATIGDTLYQLAHHPNQRFLFYSDSTEKAEGFLLGVKAHILGQVPGSTFRDIFALPGRPGWELDPKKGTWNLGAIVIAPRTHTHSEPSIDTAGVETSKTGKHYGHIKFDDIVSDKNTTTKELMDKVADVYKNADALLERSGQVDLIGTRWHYGDLYGRLIAQYKDRPGLSIFHRQAHDGPRYFFQDIGKESLTPERVANLRWKWGSYKFSCLMQNQPVDDETAIFKPSDLTFYNPQEIPHGLYITCCLDPIPPHEKTSSGDDSALTIVGTDHELNLYILDIIAGRLQPSEQIEAIFQLHAKWGIRALGVETNAFQKVMRRDIEFRYKEERLRNPDFKFFHIEEFVGSSLPNKRLRIRGLQPYHERGALRFPGTSLELLTDHFHTLAWQLLQEPKSAKDDLADSLAGHIQLHQAGTTETPVHTAPWSSAAWYEQEYWLPRALEARERQPRWRRPPVPELSLS